MARTFFYFLLVLCVVCYATLGGRNGEEFVVETCEEIVAQDQTPHLEPESETECEEATEVEDVKETILETVKCTLKPAQKYIYTIEKPVVQKQCCCPCETSIQEEIVEEPKCPNLKVMKVRKVPVCEELAEPVEKVKAQLPPASGRVCKLKMAAALKEQAQETQKTNQKH